MKLHSSGAGLQDQILAAEKAGRWTDALELHEHVLQCKERAPTDSLGLLPARRGRLQCLLQMGHLEAMLTEVRGWSMGADGAQPSLS